MRSKEKVTVKWNKKEKDFIARYPEWPNRNPRILANNIFTMLQEFEKWKGISLIETIKEAGFDPDTFVISVNAKIN
jgi:hypothetical protein